jgi:hypothetical protein
MDAFNSVYNLYDQILDAIKNNSEEEFLREVTGDQIVDLLDDDNNSGGNLIRYLVKRHRGGVLICLYNKIPFGPSFFRVKYSFLYDSVMQSCNIGYFSIIETFLYEALFLDNGIRCCLQFVSNVIIDYYISQDRYPLEERASILNSLLSVLDEPRCRILLKEHGDILSEDVK